MKFRLEFRLQALRSLRSHAAEIFACQIQLKVFLKHILFFAHPAASMNIFITLIPSHFSTLVMFCGTTLCETAADKVLKFTTKSSSSPPSSYQSLIASNRDIETSSKEIMLSYMLAGWKTRIDPGD